MPTAPTLALTLNGQARELAAPAAHTSLLTLLRGLGVVGAKEGCAEGECGACAVAMVLPAVSSSGSRIRAVNACLFPAAAAHGCEIWTVEGLADGATLHPAQQVLADHSGSQCGYCTPGFVVSIAAAQADGQTLDDHVIAGNLCRCTGYRPISAAVATLATAPAPNHPLTSRAKHPAPTPDAVHFEHADGAFSRPSTLDEVFDLLSLHPTWTVVAGATDLFVEANLLGRRFEGLLAVDHLPQLRVVETTSELLRIGAAVTLAELGELVDVVLLRELVPLFASGLVRHRATLGGSLVTASPIGDLAPVLLALGASLEVASHQGTRTVPIEDFFQGYRKTALAPAELLVAITIPLPVATTTHFEKFSKRRHDDISTAAFAGALHLDQNGRMHDVRLGLGGVAATPLRARGAEAQLEGQVLSPPVRTAALAALAAEIAPLDDHRGSAEYRRAMMAAALEALLDKVAP